MKQVSALLAGLLLSLSVPVRNARAESNTPAASSTTTATPAAAPAAAASPAPSQAEKIIFTFKDEDQMKTFAQLWQQRRGMLVRMSVLKAYFEEEQARLQELDQKLSADYKIDVNKNYILDSKRRVIVESNEPAEGAAGTSAAGAVPAAAPAGSANKQ